MRPSRDKKPHITERVLTKNSKEGFSIPTEADAMAETHRRDGNIHNRQEILINENTRILKQEVSATRKIVNYGKRHFCRKHAKRIDKKHINECDCISKNLKYPITHFN